jgi:hypothetical protein
MEAMFSSETSADFRQTIRRYVPEDRNASFVITAPFDITVQTTNNKIQSLLWRKFCIRNKVTRDSGWRTTAMSCLLRDTVCQALPLQAVHLEYPAHR